MPSARYSGARPSNAGDDYHELWALVKALELLDQSSDLQAIRVEDVSPEAATSADAGTWDGVDCTFYYGGDSEKDAQRIEFDQVKYSSANPKGKWIISRLTDGKQVFQKLAKIFRQMKKDRPDLISSNNLVIRLVSNQAVGPSVFDALNKSGTQGIKNHAKLLKASGLSKKDFQLFLQCLDLSHTGGESRAGLGMRVMQTIFSWTDYDSQLLINDLRQKMREMVMPEAAGKVITKETLLSWLRISSKEALLPCPSAIEHIDNDELISREASIVVAELMITGQNRLYLHGPGGSGKTTALQEIRDLLPAHSETIVFDCYGGGRYLDPSAQRHRPQEAFLHLCNEMAARLKTPLLITQQEIFNYAKSFKRRLDKAAELITARSPDALLVIVIDAADNSVTAADRASSEKSFVFQFARILDLPVNVRFLITSRTGRKETLELPVNFEEVEISGFNSDETGLYVHSNWSDATEEWIDDFHYFSQGIPRVQHYAIEISNGIQSKALEALQPGGKDLETIFNSQFDQARDKGATEQELEVFSAGLVALPRPIPVATLSIVTGIPESQIIDICSDLVPGLHMLEDLEQTITFADEDFEQFIRDLAETEMENIYPKIASHFWDEYPVSDYASTNVANAQYQAKRHSKILELIELEPEPKAISDAVLKRSTQLQRLALAMKVCRQTNNNVDAILTILRGAEALKTNTVIQDTLVGNPDLTASFSTSSIGRTILGFRERYKSHGPLLFHLAAEYARRGDGVSMREHFRLLHAWLNQRQSAKEQRQKENPDSRSQYWPIADDDVVAGTEAVLLTKGPGEAINYIRRWNPKSLGLVAARKLGKRLIINGKQHVVEDCLASSELLSPWDLFLLVPLALSGNRIDLERLTRSINKLHRHNLITFRNYPNIESDAREDFYHEYLETILTAAEITIANGGDKKSIVPALEALADPSMRRWDSLHSSQVKLIDLQLRAHGLLQCLDGKELTLDSFLVKPLLSSSELSEEETKAQERRADKNKKEFEDFLKPFIDLYDLRTKVIVGELVAEQSIKDLKEIIKGIAGQEHRLRVQFSARAMKKRAAISLSRLLVIEGIESTELLDCAVRLLNYNDDYLADGDADVYEEFALRSATHQIIQQAAIKRTSAIKLVKASAEEKILALVRFARLLSPLSYPDAEAIFNDVLEVAGEVNVDAFKELELFETFVDRAILEMSEANRRTTSINLAKVVSDVSIRLEGHERYPWKSASYTLATLDLNVAFATAARWEDADITSRGDLLNSFIDAALNNRYIHPAQIASLSPLIEKLNTKSLTKLIDNALLDMEAQDYRTFTEHLAKEELLRWGKGMNPDFSGALNKLPPQYLDGFWCQQLSQSTSFHQQLSKEVESPDQQQSEVLSVDKNVFTTDFRPTSAKEVHQEIVRRKVERNNDSPIKADDFKEVQQSLHISGRIHFLEALCRFEDYSYHADERANLLLKCVTLWSGGAIDDWCRMRLPEILKAYLPGFCLYIAEWHSPLPELITQTKISNSTVVGMLIEGIELHIDELNAGKLLRLVRLIGQHISQEDASEVTTRYSERLLARVPEQDVEQWDSNDIPLEINQSLARYLYALMSDVDQRIRWRATHCIRNLARLGDNGVIHEITELFNKRIEQSFRDPEKPFYWLSARLWLMLAMQKIAIESPVVCEKFADWLVSIARNVAFPHLLIRSLAIEALEYMADAGHISLTTDQLNKLKTSLAPQPRIPRVRGTSEVGFNQYEFSDPKERRFQFDSSNTLHHWYTGALRIFADVTEGKLLDVAEKWIVEEWGVRDNPWEWKAEPRGNRLSDSNWRLMKYGDGGFPIMERYSSYLEWHAMWCSIGELMQTQPLALPNQDDDSYYTFEDWLGRNSLSISPLWLSDLHLPKPLEPRLWNTLAKDIDEWADNPTLSAFTKELLPESSIGQVVVSGHHRTYSSQFTLESRINSALVSPETARSLLNALQSTKYSWDYALPLADHDSDINISELPFQLQGWLVSNETLAGIDENDSMRFTLDRIDREPASEIVKSLNLHYKFQEQAMWLDENEVPVFTYRAWSDLDEQRNDGRVRYTEDIISQGYWLEIDQKVLQALLNDLGFDLIVQIEMLRRNAGYGDYSRVTEEKKKESDYDRVLLLRRDGTIEGVEGPIGSWAISGP